jgi:hypothetical protein
MQLSSPIALVYTRWLGEGVQGHSSFRPLMSQVFPLHFLTPTFPNHTFINVARILYLGEGLLKNKII